MNFTRSLGIAGHEGLEIPCRRWVFQVANVGEQSQKNYSCCLAHFIGSELARKTVREVLDASHSRGELPKKYGYVRLASGYIASTYLDARHSRIKKILLVKTLINRYRLKRL